MVDIYREIADHAKVKKAFVSSGIRYDILFGKTEKEEKQNGCNDYAEQVIKHHVSGRLKVAPEHSSDKVLKLMRKPSFKFFQKFKQQFENINLKNGLNQQLIPYFISSHPGSQLENMAELAVETKSLGFKLEQVQDFTPTPMTLATVMYYTGIDPYTGKEIHTARTKEEKLSQRKFFFWYKKEYRSKIINELKHSGRQDIIKKLFN